MPPKTYAPLTDTQCRNAKCPPDKRHIRLYDAGGLYLEVAASGRKGWYQKFRVQKDGKRKEQRLSLGGYPAVSLADARRKVTESRRVLEAGQNPVAERRKARQQQARGDTFATVAEEWFAKQLASSAWADGGARIRHFLADLLPALGARPMQEIEPPELLAVLQQTARRGALETAERERTMASQVWRYSIQTGRVQRDIAADLRGALPKPIARHMAAVTTPQALAPLLRAIRAYRGHSLVVPTALQLAPMLFQRPHNLRRMRWQEIDWQAATWTIPSAEMKRSKAAKMNGAPHIVPLPRQALELLAALRPYTDSPACGGWCFPGGRQRDRSLSENALRVALIDCGIPPDVQTAHGFRATARSILDEVLEFHPWIIEAQLAHEVKDANGRAYNRTKHLQQRTQMMQRWADYLDELASGAAGV